nr:G patch domain-containing protein TGH [Tanacetum cinerariifolium]
AIISDDSGDEEESNTNTDQPNDPTTKIQVANIDLTRILAGDFLESLGKELGLEVPPDEPYAEKHCGCWSGYNYYKILNAYVKNAATKPEEEKFRKI